MRGAVETRIDFAEEKLKLDVQAIPLHYGSDFEPVSRSGKEPGATLPRRAPSSGYFELINKSLFFCCVKVIHGTVPSPKEFDTLWEIPRPSYMALPPGGILHGTFDPSLSHIEVLLLTRNPIGPPEMDGSAANAESLVNYNTKSGKGERAAISPCASVSGFRQFFAYRVHSSGRNVLLKFKGEAAPLEPRQGNSVGRVGMLKKLTSFKGSSPKGSGDAATAGSTDLDFENTNIPADALQLICSSLA